MSEIKHQRVSQRSCVLGQAQAFLPSNSTSKRNHAAAWRNKLYSGRMPVIQNNQVCQQILSRRWKSLFSLEKPEYIIHPPSSCPSWAPCVVTSACYEPHAVLWHHYRLLTSSTLFFFISPALHLAPCLSVPLIVYVDHRDCVWHYDYHHPWVKNPHIAVVLSIPTLLYPIHYSSPLFILCTDTSGCCHGHYFEILILFLARDLSHRFHFKSVFHISWLAKQTKQTGFLPQSSDSLKHYTHVTRGHKLNTGSLCQPGSQCLFKMSSGSCTGVLSELLLTHNKQWESSYMTVALGVESRHMSGDLS